MCSVKKLYAIFLCIFSAKEIDPVYSLLKCAADLPKGARIPCIVHSQCAGQHNPDSSSSTSKTSSPSSSGRSYLPSIIGFIT